jgi:hypothetical protein
MISWTAHGLLVHHFAEQRDIVANSLSRLQAAWPRFTTVPYEVGLLPAVLSSRGNTSLGEFAEAYVRIVEQVIDLYRAHEEIRYLLPYGALEHELVMLEPGYRPFCQIARMDGFIDPRTGTPRLIELNADSPGGVFYTSRFNRSMRSLLADSGMGGVEWEENDIDRETAFLTTVLGAYRQWSGGDAVPAIAVLVAREAPSAEAEDLVAFLCAAGLEATVVDPRDIEVHGGVATANSRRVDVCWSKIDTLGWRMLDQWKPGLAVFWKGLIERRVLCHLNSFAARIVAEDQRIPALLHRPEIRQCLHPADLAVVSRFLPVTHSLAETGDIEIAGRAGPTGEIAVDLQSSLVIKEAHNCRGYGVTVGRETSGEDWRAALARVTKLGGIIQEAQETVLHPFIAATDLDVAGAAAFRQLRLGCDAFVLAGKYAGPAGKVGSAGRLNVHQGGGRVAVMSAACPHKERTSHDGH